MFLSYPQIVLTMAAIALVAIVIYGPTLGGGFYLDDDILIMQSDSSRPAHLPATFRTHFLPGFVGAESLYYRSLITASYQLDYSLSGLDPQGCRVTNLLLYLICAGLVFALARRLTKSTPTAGLSGLAFIMLPSHSESAAREYEATINCGKLPPRDEAQYCFMLGRIYGEKMGDVNGAVRNFEHAVKADPAGRPADNAEMELKSLGAAPKKTSEQQ